MRTPLLIMLCLTGAGFFAGCDGDHPSGPQGQTGLATMKTRLGSADFTLEVADTNSERETGLMYRTSMPADHGMIFVFPESETRQFYMANTKIPLDIAFIDPEGKVVSIKSMKPLDLRITSSDYPARYAIEMNEGAATASGLHVGDIVKVPSSQP